MLLISVLRFLFYAYLKQRVITSFVSRVDGERAKLECHTSGVRQENVVRSYRRSEVRYVNNFLQNSDKAKEKGTNTL